MQWQTLRLVPERKAQVALGHRPVLRQVFFRIDLQRREAIHSEHRFRGARQHSPRSLRA